MAETLGLDEIESADRGRVGGKAAALAALKRRGLPVPDGFVLVAGAGLAAGRREALLAAYRRLGGRVAVRSSSSAEDLAAASFAGQYETVLDVSGDEAVVAAALRCLASAGAAHAYANALGAPAGAMAVLVQRFVEPRAAGVAFTRDPSDPSALLIESHAGRGDALVSGRVTPDRYVVDRASGALRGSLAGSLDAASLGVIASLAQQAEHAFGAPQDVEWAIGEAGPVLLQSRPITVENEAPLHPGARRLTRANVGEVLPDPVTPLTWTSVCAFLEHGFRETARAAGLLPAGLEGHPFLVLHRRRVYLNLSLSVQVATRLPGVSAADAERLVLGAAGAAGHPSLPPAAVLALARVLLRLLALDHRLPRDIAAAEAAVRGLPSREAVAAAAPERLAGLLDGFLAAGRAIATPHIATSGASAFRLAVLGRAAQAWARGEPGDLVNRLVAGLPDVASAAPALALETLAAEARGRTDWRAFVEAERLPAFLRAYGHRAVSEGELSAASWEDDPRPLFDALAALIVSPRAAGFGHRARAGERRADEQAILHRLDPLRGALFRALLRGAQSWVRERERTKSLAIEVVAHGRRVAHAAARQLVAQGRLREEGDVFFLTLDELRAALAGGLAPVAAIARRRRRHERESALPAPRDVNLEAPEADRAPGRSWQGIGVSSGVGAGKARIARPGEAVALRPGEVLVAPVLDAALGPLLVSAAAAIAEIGGALSHGSVVARELGVPCVVDLRDATRRIRDGDRVVVDGASGRVEVTAAADVSAGAAEAAPRALAVADPAEERLHAFEDGKHSRESVYFNLQDPQAGIGIIASQGVRPGSRGEAVCVLALPDGRVLSAYELARPRIRTAGFGVGGLETRWSPAGLAFYGRMAAWEGSTFPPGPLPLMLAPRTVEVSVDLVFHPTTPAVDLVQVLSDQEREALMPMGRHHVEQSGVCRGELTIDGRSWNVTATGSRDHSWGPRVWDATDHWHLFTVRLGDDLALHALSTSVNGRRARGGFLWKDGRAQLVTRVEHALERGGRSFELEVTTDTGTRLGLRGEILRTLVVPVDVERRPLRQLAGKPYALVLHENFTRYTAEGRTGHGIAEWTERPS